MLPALAGWGGGAIHVSINAPSAFLSVLFLRSTTAIPPLCRSLMEALT